MSYSNLAFHRNKIRLFSIVFFWVLSACSSKELPTPQQPANKVTNKDARQLASDRTESFSKDLSLTIRTRKSIISQQGIDLVLEIRNMASHPIVLKTPRSTGIASSYIFKSAFNDVNIFLVDRNENLVMNVLPSSQFYSDPRMRDVIEPYLWHKQKDFVILQLSETYEYKYSTETVYSIPENATSYQQIAVGEYFVYAVYYNGYIGYHAVDTNNIENFNFLFEDNSLIFDLNAWVGEVVSNTVSVTLKQ
ncbi:MAG: hypothetical protein HZB50_12370 [Chloroflexi bacterium]|nr:hypothetical protein [Chloroflexota bacterium]